MKSRGVYETPGEPYCTGPMKNWSGSPWTAAPLQFKAQMAIKYAELVYDGYWFARLRYAMDAFINETQKNVTGTVRVKLYKGNCEAVAATSPYSLYSRQLATFSQDELYSHKDAAGFINLSACPCCRHSWSERARRLRSNALR